MCISTRFYIIRNVVLVTHKFKKPKFPGYFEDKQLFKQIQRVYVYVYVFYFTFLSRDEIAYCSADKLVYIRSFSEDGSQMKLKAVLQGHEAEVTHVQWNSIHRKWVTGSDDCTIRVWVGSSVNFFKDGYL